MRLDKLEIRWLKLFCHIVEKGGITNAEKITGLSQPVLSHYLGKLEEMLGIVLCERGRGGFSVTEEGKVAYAEAKKLIQTLEDFGNRLAGIQHKLVGQARIGCLDNTITHPGEVLQRAVAKLYQRSPEVTVEPQIGDYLSLMEKLKKGELDMVISVLPNPPLTEMQIEPLFSELSFCYAPADIAERVEQEWRQGTLDPERLMMRGYTSYEICHLFGVAVEQQVKSTEIWPFNLEMSLMMMLAGAYVIFLPNHYAERWVNQKRIQVIAPQELKLHSTFHLIRQANRRLSPVAEVLWQYLLEAGKPFLTQ